MIDPHSYDSCRLFFASYQIPLSPEQYEKLRTYADLLVDESKRQNVTAVRGLSEIWIRHFLDAAFLLRHLPETAKILDMGTGGGIPAIPLAIMQTGLHVTMLDSELRKIDFCRSVADQLSLDADCLCGRAEELAHDPAYRAQFDIVVSRAMAGGSMLTELSVPFLKTGGFLYAMKGKQYDPETERFESAADALGASVISATPYTLCEEQKYLICIQKTADTPDKYPRRFAKIKRSPL